MFIYLLPVSLVPLQIATTNYKREHGPITRQKLGREVAKLIEEHLKVRCLGNRQNVPLN